MWESDGKKSGTIHTFPLLLNWADVKGGGCNVNKFLTAVA